MAKETIKDFKTVEETREITVCDNCNRTDEETEVINVVINPRAKIKEKHRAKQIAEFEDYSVAQREAQKLNNQKIDLLETSRFGVFREEDITTINNSASTDLCAECVDKFFGKENVEGDVTDIEINDGEVVIEKEKVIERNYPQFKLPNRLLFLATVIFSPAIIIATFIGIFNSAFVINTENVNNIVAGVGIGMIGWSLVFLLLSNIITLSF